MLKLTSLPPTFISPSWPLNVALKDTLSLKQKTCGASICLARHPELEEHKVVYHSSHGFRGQDYPYRVGRPCAKQNKQTKTTTETKQTNNPLSWAEVVTQRIKQINKQTSNQTNKQSIKQITNKPTNKTTPKVGGSNKQTSKQTNSLHNYTITFTLLS